MIPIGNKWINFMQIPDLNKRIEARQKPQNRIPVMHQKWRDLLFLHWSYDPVKLQKTLPEGLFVDTFDNTAYVGITPFFLFDVRPNFLPSVKAVSNFSEVNVRTYVYDKDGTPGIYFYSLDANQPFAVELAKFFHLPYFHAEIESHKEGHTDSVFFKVKRDNSPEGSESEFIYKMIGDEFFAESGTLEFFLTERYYLFTQEQETQQLYKGRVYHMPYPLHFATVLKYDTKLLNLSGFDISALSPDNILASSGVDVDVFKLTRIDKE
jgi:uncharacterized protein